jgi:outer membrane protein OmpA-like peptidoglycan-associated protein
MNSLKIAVLAVLVLLGVTNTKAQDKNNPWAISIGVNAIDFHPTGYEMDAYNRDGMFSEYFNMREHYNFIPTISSIGLGRYFGKGLSADLGVNFNKISILGNDEEYNPGDWMYFAADASLKYNILDALQKKYWIAPFVKLGAAYNILDEDSYASANGGVGIDFALHENINLTVQSLYKHSLDNSLAPLFQHNLGLTVKFGGKDTDNDGVYDKDDACPEVFGLEEFAGCPDTDGDGIKDSDDQCPEVAGPVEFNGCPDQDGDGVLDKDDACPEVKGTPANNGCPDSDGDGVVDKKDDCPKVAGASANKGCPWPDTDGDGILDKDDKCPKVAGLAEENGCPASKEKIEQEAKQKIYKEIETKIDTQGDIIYFNTSRSNIKRSERNKLDKWATIIKNYNTVNFLISGHADSEGPDDFNQKLSDSRANNVLKYLVKNGVEAGQLTTVGYGENQPAADNNTQKGKAKNRRVEISIVK